MTKRLDVGMKVTKWRRLRITLYTLTTMATATVAISVTNSCGNVTNACAQDCPAGPQGPAGPPGDSVWTDDKGSISYAGTQVRITAESQDGLNIFSSSGNYLILGVVNGSGVRGYVRVAGYNSAEVAGKNLVLQDSGGNVGIGTTNPTYRLHVNGDAAGTSWTNLSSRDFKEHIHRLDDLRHQQMRTLLMGVHLVTYRYKPEYGDQSLDRLGFIAEEMPSEVLSRDGKGVDLYELQAYTVGAMKAMNSEMERMRHEIEKLRATCKR